MQMENVVVDRKGCERGSYSWRKVIERRERRSLIRAGVRCADFGALKDEDIQDSLRGLQIKLELQEAAILLSWRYAAGYVQWTVIGWRAPF